MRKKSDEIFLLILQFIGIAQSFSATCPVPFSGSMTGINAGCSITDPSLVCLNSKDERNINGGGFFAQSAGNNTRWTLYSPDVNDVISVSFSEFSLGGPKCENGMQPDEFASVTMVGNEMKLPRFCAGRPPSRNTVYSSQGYLSVILCNGNQNTKLSFTAKAGRNWWGLASKSDQTITISSPIKGEKSWIYIEEISGRYDIKLTLDDFLIKKKCSRAYIKIDDAISKHSLISDNREMLCNDTGLPWKNPVVITTQVSKINITHRNAKFRLTFKAIEKVLTTTTIPATTTLIPVQMKKLPKYNNPSEDQTPSSVPMIVIGCIVGLLVITIVCIAALYVCKKQKMLRNNNNFNGAPVTESVDNFEFHRTKCEGTGVNNMMYEKVLDGSAENGTCGSSNMSSQRPLLNATPNYAKVNKTKRDNEIRGPHPLPRSNAQNLSSNMYETIEDATARFATNGFTACNSKLVNTAHSVETDDESDGSGYIDHELIQSHESPQFNKKFSVSESMPNMQEPTSQYEPAMNEYNKPRPSIPNLFIQAAYTSSQDLNVKNETKNFKSTNSLDVNSAHLLLGDNTSSQQFAANGESDVPINYYDSPRPSLANISAIQVNNDGGQL